MDRQDEVSPALFLLRLLPFGVFVLSTEKGLLLLFFFCDVAWMYCFDGGLPIWSSSNCRHIAETLRSDRFEKQGQFHVYFSCGPFVSSFTFRLLILKNGYNALMLASEKGHADVVELLLQHNAQVNLQNKVGLCNGSFNLFVQK